MSLALVRVTLGRRKVTKGVRARNSQRGQLKRIAVPDERHWSLDVANGACLIGCNLGLSSDFGRLVRKK